MASLCKIVMVLRKKCERRSSIVQLKARLPIQPGEVEQSQQQQQLMEKANFCC